MLAAKRIIVPVTFAEDSLEAVAVAATLARALGAELILAGIAPLASPEPFVDGAGGTDTIVRLAEEQKLVDQIVCERRRHTELAHPFHDHADRYVLHHSDVPVLVVPTEGSRERTSSE